MNLNKIVSVTVVIFCEIIITITYNFKKYIVFLKRACDFF